MWRDFGNCVEQQPAQRASRPFFVKFNNIIFHKQRNAPYRKYLSTIFLTFTEILTQTHVFK